MQQTQPDDLIPVRQAQALLTVSKVKMAQIIKEGLLTCWIDPLDKRVKLVSRTEVENLKNPRRRAA